MATKWLQLTPLDAVTVRDGRPFGAETDSWSEMVKPSPATVAGAVHAATKKVEGFRRLGPGLISNAGEVFAPWPQALVVDEDESPPKLRWLRPTDAPGLDISESGSRVSIVISDIAGSDTKLRLLSGQGKRPETQWIRLAHLARFMSGEISEMDCDGGGEDVSAVDEHFTPERHVGLYRSGKQAETGFLYSVNYIRLDETTSLLARVTPRGQIPPDLNVVVPFGGERGLVEVTVRHDNRLGIARTDHYPNGRVVVYLAAPAFFASGWHPDVPEDASLVGAAVAGPEPVAGWTKGSRRQQPSYVLRHAAPAGSVYWFEFEGPNREERAGSWARSLHANSLPQTHPTLRAQGFGWCFTGTWS